jgi:hypothetical protein
MRTGAIRRHFRRGLGSFLFLGHPAILPPKQPPHCLGDLQCGQQPKETGLRHQTPSESIAHCGGGLRPQSSRPHPAEMPSRSLWPAIYHR